MIDFLINLLWFIGAFVAVALALAGGLWLWERDETKIFLFFVACLTMAGSGIWAISQAGGWIRGLF